MVEVFKDIAFSALAILVAVLAIYFALKLLGKLAKFVIGIVVLAFVLWLLFAEGSVIHQYLPWAESGFAAYLGSLRG